MVRGSGVAVRWRRGLAGAAVGAALAAAVVVGGGTPAQAICPLPAPETCDGLVVIDPVPIGDGTTTAAATLFVTPYNPDTVRAEGLTFTLANNPSVPLPPIRTYTFAQHAPAPPIRQTPQPPIRVELPSVGTLELASITVPQRQNGSVPIPPVRVSAATLYSADSWTVTPLQPQPPIRVQGQVLSAIVRLAPNPPLRAGQPIPPMVEGSEATFVIAGS